MQATDIDHDNHQRYWISTYSQEIVALPPINEQQRIIAQHNRIVHKIKDEN